MSSIFTLNAPSQCRNRHIVIMLRFPSLVATTLLLLACVLRQATAFVMPRPALPTMSSNSRMVRSLVFTGLFVLPNLAYPFISIEQTDAHTPTEPPSTTTPQLIAPLSMSKDLVGFGEDLDGSACRIGIVKTRWNPEIVDSLYEGVRAALKETGVKDANIYDTTVPGSFELPLAARFLAMSRQCDVVITIGCLIKGDTMHFEYIAEAVTKGLMDVRTMKLSARDDGLRHDNKQSFNPIVY